MKLHDILSPASLNSNLGSLENNFKMLYQIQYSTRIGKYEWFCYHVGDH